MISLAIAFVEFPDFRSLFPMCKMKWLRFWHSKGFKESFVHCVLEPEKRFTWTLQCDNLFDISQPLICSTTLFPNMMTDFSFFLSFLFSFWCSSFVSLLCCSVLLLLYFVAWLWSFLALSLSILLAPLTHVLLIFCCMLELPVSFVKITSSEPLWVFTSKLCFRFSWWWTLFASVLRERDRE